MNLMERLNGRRGDSPRRQKFSQPGLWAAIGVFGSVAVLLAAGCGGSDSTAGLTPKQNARNVNVGGVQSLGAGRAMPFAGLNATMPTAVSGSLQPDGFLDTVLNPAFGLYQGDPIISGNKQTTPYFTDSALQNPAGTISYTTPGSSYSTNYVSYPALVTMVFNVTGGNMPAEGAVTIEYLSATGANKMNGQLKLKKSGIVVNLAMTLSDAKDVGGELDFSVLGLKTRFFNLNGKVNAPIAGEVEVASLGWTGTGSINLATGAFSTNLDTGTGVVNASIDSSGHLDISYPDGSTEEIEKPMSEPLVGGGTSSGSSGGLTNSTGTNTTGTNTTGTNTTGTNTTGTNTTGTNTTGGGEYGTPVIVNGFPNGMSGNGKMVGVFNNEPGYCATASSAPTTVLKPASATFASLLDVNNSGQMVGFATISGSTTSYYWSSPSAVPVAIKVPEGFVAADVRAINNNGQMVGTVTMTSNQPKPAYWPSPTSEPELLPLPQDETRGDTVDINDAGQIIGHIPQRGVSGTAYYWSSPTATPTAFASGSGTSPLVEMMNGSGVVVGTVLESSKRLPVKWTSGSSNPTSLTLLSGDVNGSAFAINDAGEAVGESVSANTVYKAVIWRGTTPTLLDSLLTGTTWKTERAFEISNNGSITGTGKQSGVDKRFAVIKN